MGPRRPIVPAERGHLPAVTPADRASTTSPTGDACCVGPPKNGTKCAPSARAE
jgi:hypothetical protein